MTRRQLPIGIQSFREIREGDYYYVDKTGYALELMNGPPGNILTRPRRFGKSVFLDTLTELLEGSRELFEGLEAYGRWDWSVTNPVVRLDFTGGDFSAPGSLRANVLAQLGSIAEAAGIEPQHDRASERFAHLLRTLHRRTGQRVAVLVDEYDKPIMDALGKPDVARARRDYLIGAYSVLKYSSRHIRFSLLTGVSKFPLAGIFSGLNNLIDATFSARYGAFCGFTQEDLDTVFAPELAGLDRKRIRDRYCGYMWGGAERVYNPHDILQVFREREFKAWWFETASPALAVETLVERGTAAPELEGMLASRRMLSDIGVDRIVPLALLFQTGYLTVADRKDRRGQTWLRLGCANGAVRQSLNASLLGQLVQDPAGQARNTGRLGQLLRSPDIEGMECLFHDFFALTPHEWQARIEVEHCDWYYASIFYSYFAALGVDVSVLKGARGKWRHVGRRLDMVVRPEGRVILLEFMVVERAGADGALARLKARGYADRYRQSGEPILLVGVEFSAETRNVEVFGEELPVSE